MRKKSNKRKKRKLSIYKLCGLFVFLLSIILCIMVTILNVLPSKYYFIMIVAFCLLNIPLDLILFRKNVKKYKKNIALFFSIIIIFIMSFSMFYISKTLGFVMSIGDTDYKLENYSLIVLKDSKYKKIDDVNNMSIGIYENSDGIKKAKNMLLDKVDVTFKSYDSIDGIGKSLLDGNIEVIFIEDSILSMIKENNPDFESSIKVIYTLSIKIKSKNSARDVNVVNEPFNIYITGIDTFGDISSVSRSDVNIVMTVNPKTKQILLTSIPRDYYVELHGKKGSRDKLTHAGIYGTDMSISTIEDLLGIEINYYLKVNFSSFINIVNALGGIEAYSKYSFTSIDGYKYTEGFNKMNGEEALSFARERKAFVDGDRQRGADQQAVIEAIIKKICSKFILTKYDSLLNSIEGEFQTNLSHNKITSLIKMQLNDMASWNVTSIVLDGSNGRGITYSGGNQELYVMLPDWNTVDEASSTIKAVLDGKKLDESFKPDASKSTRVMKSYNNSNTLDNSSKKKNNNNDDNNAKNNSVNNNNNNIEDKKQNTDIISSNNEEDNDNIKEVEVIVDKKNNNENNDKNKDNNKNDDNVKDDSKENIDEKEENITQEDDSNIDNNNSNENNDNNVNNDN